MIAHQLLQAVAGALQSLDLGHLIKEDQIQVEP